MKKQVYSNKTTIRVLAFCMLVFIGITCLGIALMITNGKAGEWHIVILALISVAWSGKEADLIELPTVQLPG